MMKIKGVIFMSIFFLMQSQFGAVTREAGASEEQNKISEEDLEIIDNLDFLDNLDLFKGDMEFLENYQDIDQSESTGESDE